MKAPAAAEASLAVPRIDLAPLRGGEPGSPAVRDVQARLLAACSEVGFVTVTGHGVARECVAATVAAARSFFALAEREKLAAAPRHWNPSGENVYRGYFPSSAAGKEGLDVGDPDLDDAALLGRPYYEKARVPAVLGAAWGTAVAEYFAALSEVAAVVLEALVTALGGTPEAVRRGFARPAALSTLRFNYYPERAEPAEVAADDGAELACEAHVDSGLLTLLHQGERGGLQVRGRDDCWHAIAPDADAFVVNAGLALQRLTAGEVVATWHRVLHSGRSRLSIPFFFEPVWDFRMDPRSLGLPHAPPGDVRTYEAHLRESLAKFAEYQR